MGSAGSPIILAFDGSPAARAGIAAAGRLFGERPAVALTAWDSVESIAPAAVAGVPAGVAGAAARRLDDEALERAERLAAEGAELARAAGLAAEARAIRTQTSPWVTICEFASEVDAGVIVVGSRGLSGLKSALLGSVSNGVVHHSGRPTLVVSEQPEAPSVAS